MTKAITITCLFLSLLIHPCQKLFAQTSASCPNTNLNFRAVYDRLLDYYSHDINVAHLAFSADGSTIFFAGKNVDSELVLRTINSDGSNLRSIPVPAGLTGVDDVTINENGSKAFFLDSGNDYVYKVEAGSATEILHRTDFSDISNIQQIETTADGNFVYFCDGGEIWRLSRNGGAPELIVDAEAVQRIEGTGRSIGEFAISSNGNIIGFIIKSYKDAENRSHTKNELFVYGGGNIKQLTNDTENVYKEHIDISGDGSTIVFSAGGPQDKYYSIKVDGTNKITLADLHSNFAALSLNYDGSQVLYKDGGARGGRLLKTDGSGGIDLFSGATLSILDNGYISNDGSMICFRYLIRSFPSRYALYVGHLYKQGLVPDAPVIESITFDPPFMPTDDPDVKIYVFSKISDPDGLEDIETVRIDALVDGILLPNDQSEVPVYFYTDPNDNGSAFDETADDGIYTIAGDPGGKIYEANQMTVRIGAMDKSSTLIVKDVILNIGGSTNVEKSEKPLNTLTLFQNYPNPFNPETKIKYIIPEPSHVVIKIYNISGKEIKTLVNKKHSPGTYVIDWEGNDNRNLKVSNGIYFCRMLSGGFLRTIKLTFLK